ncbi:MAG TPA: hypothetical protein VII69_02970 [Candidatus Eremiobacteraceae bacterium]
MTLQSIAIDSLLALSVWCTLGTGRLTLAGPGFMAFGAYVAFLIGQHMHASMWLCIVAGAAASTLLGAVVDLCVSNLSNAPYTIATLSFTLVVPAIATAAHVVRGPVHPLGNAFSAIVCLAAGLPALAFARDRWRFAAGAAAAGLAGALYWTFGGALNPSAFGLDRVGVMVAVAVVGGAGSPLAAVLGAVLLAALARLAAPLTDQALIVDGVALIVVLVYLPDGVWPRLISLWRAVSRSPGRLADGTA